MKLDWKSCVLFVLLLYNGIILALAAVHTEFSKIICENKSETVTCPSGSGQFMNITYANYGRLSNSHCPISRQVTNCRAAVSLIIVRNKCHGLNSCTLQSSNSVFGDPCVSVFKYLEIRYTCVNGNKFPSIPSLGDAYVYGNQMPFSHVMNLTANESLFVERPYYYSIFNITQVQLPVEGNSNIYKNALTFLASSQYKPSTRSGVCWPNINDQASEFCIYRNNGYLYLRHLFMPVSNLGKSYKLSILVRDSSATPLVRKTRLTISVVPACFPMTELYRSVKANCTHNAVKLRFPSSFHWSGTLYGKQIPIAAPSPVTIAKVYIDVDLLANFYESNAVSARYNITLFLKDREYQRTFVYYKQAGNTATTNGLPQVSGSKLNITLHPPIEVTSLDKFVNVSLKLISPQVRTDIVFNSENSVLLYGSKKLEVCPGSLCLDAYKSWANGISKLRFTSRNGCIVDDFLQEEYLKPCRKSLLLVVPQSTQFFQPLQLVCQGNSTAQITWYKDNAVLKSTSKELSLSGQAYLDQGYYHCVAKSSGLQLSSREILFQFNDVYKSTLYLEITNQAFTTDLNDQRSLGYRDLSNKLVQSVVEVLTGLPSKRPHDVNVEQFSGTQSVLAKLKIYSNVLAQTSIESFYSNMKKLLLAGVNDRSFGSLQIFSQTIIILNHDYCLPQTTNQETSKGPYSWPLTKFQRNISIKCPNGPAGKHATRVCSGNFTAGAVWLNVRDIDCGYNNKRTQQLDALSKIVVNESNAATVATELEKLTTNASSLTTDDTVLASEAFSNVVAMNVASDKIVDDLLLTASNLLQVNETVLSSSQSNKKALTNIVKGIESLADKIQLPNNSGEAVVKVASGVAIQAVQLDNNSSSVLTFALKKPDFNLQNVISNQKYQANGVSIGISLPETILSDIKGKSAGRLSFVAYKGGQFFQSTKKDALGHRVRDPAGTPNSMIISAHVKGEKQVNLSKPLNGTFRKLNASLADKCVFWDFAANDGYGGWSSKGCRKLAGDNRVVCQCDHMTNFAILFDVYAGKQKSSDETHEKILGIISFIGIGLSLGGLGITLLTLALFRRLRRNLPSRILIHLCLSLMLTLLCFVIGADMTTPVYACRGFAIAIQYFLLVCFSWMVVEAVNLYLSFVIVMGTYISRFMIKAGLCAWGLPLIIVGFTAWQRFEDYGNERYCVVTGWAAYGTLFAPICLAILMNFVVFVMVLRSLMNSAKGKKISKDQKRSGTSQFRIAATFSCILGLTWVFGLFAIADARIVFQYLFCICNGLQGFTIFFLHVARQREARNHWIHFLTGNGLNYYRSSLMSTSRGKTVRPPNTGETRARISSTEKSSTLTSNLSNSDALKLSNITGRLNNNAPISSDA